MMNKRAEDPNLCGCSSRGVNQGNCVVLMVVNDYFIIYDIYQLNNGCLDYIITTRNMHEWSP
jgi:hypothetical protein